MNYGPSFRVFATSVAPSIYRLRLKRLFDVVGALIVLIGLAPLFLLLSAVIKFETGGAVFSTARKRQYGRTVPVFQFSIEKCRESTVQFIVRTGADRLPLLLSVLRGDISIVGPVSAADLVIPAQYSEALQKSPLKPGLIGPKPRDNLRLDQIEADFNYVSQWSLWLDMKILIQHAVSAKAYT